MDPETWPMVVRPMLSDRRGRAFFISTPTGLNHFYELYIVAPSRSDWEAFHFRTEDGGYIAPDELAVVQAETDDRRYAQEFDASFETSEARVYHAFDRE